VDSVPAYPCESYCLLELKALTERTKVIQYDSGPLAVLKNASDFEAYISQNNNWEIQRWRQVRLSLRALEGQKVIWPYEHVIVSIYSRPSYLRCLPPSSADW
jgi:hypothetical protein